ncbi:MAG: hypothetical protein J7K68_00490 [Candidatus Diapherotrites archaeon]|nr:hypothetical protein [Candidatus Diapherotrites archaeon]
MGKGISPAISFMIIVAIVAIGAVAVYFWVSGTLNQPVVKEQPVPIQAYAYNSSAIKVINIGTTNSSEITYLNTSVGACTFSGATVLEPGVAETCVLPVQPSGPVTLYSGATKSFTVSF